MTARSGNHVNPIARVTVKLFSFRYPHVYRIIIKKKHQKLFPKIHIIELFVVLPLEFFFVTFGGRYLTGGNNRKVSKVNTSGFGVGA